MVVAVDECRYHGLAGEIHTSRALWGLTLTLLADPREGVTLHEERGVLNGRAAVADDEPRTFEPKRRAPSALSAGVDRKRQCDEQAGQGCAPQAAACALTLRKGHSGCSHPGSPSRAEYR